MRLSRFFILVLLISYNISNVRASHIMGGEMFLKHLSGERFNLGLNLYYDGINGQDDVEDSIKVTAFNKFTNEFVKEFTLVRPSSYVSAPYAYPACSREGLNVRVYSYSNTVFLEDNLFNSPDGYYLSWQRCCRSNTISNLSGSEIEGFLYYMEVPNQSVYIGNSSPVFDALAGEFLCVGKSSILDFSADDANGDSLKYEIIIPSAGFSTPDNNVIAGQSGPYPLVTGYSGIPGLNTSNLNKEGIIEFTPTAQGIFQIAVRCEEFRNGVKLGQVTREMQFLVKDCGENNIPEIKFFNIDFSEEYSNLDTILLETQDDLCFKVQINDNDIGDLVYLSYNTTTDNGLKPDISPANGSLNENGVFIADFCFPTCKNTAVTFFQGQLEIRDDFCPDPGLGEIGLNFKIKQSENRPPEITTDFQDIRYNQNEQVSFRIFANDPDSIDELSITMEGVGFSPQELNMSLLSDNIGNSLEANFTWIPSCLEVPESGEFPLIFNASDKNCGMGGFDTLGIAIRLNPYEKDFFENRPANVITANGDNLNDYFSIPELSKNPCLSDSFEKIEIYNRWGRSVFNSDKIDFEWLPIEPAGDYFYILKMSRKIYRGSIKVMR